MVNPDRPFAPGSNERDPYAFVHLLMFLVCLRVTQVGVPVHLFKRSSRLLQLRGALASATARPCPCQQHVVLPRVPTSLVSHPTTPSPSCISWTVAASSVAAAATMRAASSCPRRHGSLDLNLAH